MTQTNTTVRLERVGDGYREPITGTLVSRIDRYGHGIDGVGQTVWELQASNGECVLARTLSDARGFLAPFVAQVQS